MDHTLLPVGYIKPDKRIQNLIAMPFSATRERKTRAAFTGQKAIFKQTSNAERPTLNSESIREQAAKSERKQRITDQR